MGHPEVPFGSEKAYDNPEINDRTEYEYGASISRIFVFIDVSVRGSVPPVVGAVLRDRIPYSGKRRQWFPQSSFR